MKSVKSSKTIISPELIRRQVTANINNFFTDENTEYYKIKYEESNYDKYGIFINLLNDKISNKSILLSDINQTYNGYIVQICLSNVNKYKIEITYHKENKKITINLIDFINNIYINKNKIFYLPSQFSDQYDTDKTRIFNIKIIHDTNLEYINNYLKTDEDYVKEIKEIYTKFNKLHNWDHENIIEFFLKTSCNPIGPTNYFHKEFLKLHNDIYNCINIYCDNISTKYKNDNTSLLMNIIEFINDYLFYIYKMYIIIEDYKDYCDSVSISSLHSSSANLKKQKSMKSNNFIDFYSHINKINKEKKYQFKIDNFTSYLKYIVHRFNIDVYNFDINHTITKLDYHKNNTNIILVEEEFIIPDDILDIIKNKELLLLYIKINKNRINRINLLSIEMMKRYITIPQYDGICWYIAIITSMTYSDLSRNLILNNPKLSSSNKFKNFEKFLLHIINEITKDGREYNLQSEILHKSDCELLDFFQETPINVLDSLIKEYINSYLNKDELISNIAIILDRIKTNREVVTRSQAKQIITSELFDENTKNFDFNNPFEEIISKNLLNNNNYVLKNNGNDAKDLFYDNIEKLTLLNRTLQQYNNSILIFFYNILNIKTLYLGIEKKDENINYYKLPSTVIDTDTSPDVIILHNFSQINTRYEKIESNITFNDDYTIITYNDNTYKMDYILHNNDYDKSCKYCSHCISSITYHNNQYVYDSKSTPINFKCPDDLNYSVPCSLLKLNWKDNIFKNKCYKVNNCGYLFDNYNTSYNTQNLSIYNLCYSYDKSYLLVFIKIN